VEEKDIRETISNIMIALGDIEIKAKQAKQMNSIMEALYILRESIGKDDRNANT
jgi:hypothetical protein